MPIFILSEFRVCLLVIELVLVIPESVSIAFVALAVIKDKLYSLPTTRFAKIVEALNKPVLINLELVLLVLRVLVLRKAVDIEEKAPCVSVKLSKLNIAPVRVARSTLRFWVAIRCTVRVEKRP